MNDQNDQTDAADAFPSVFLYACETWTLITAGLQRRTQAMEMRCYRNSLRVSHTDDVTNVEVRNGIKHATRSHEDLLTTVPRRKLKWCVHVSLYHPTWQRPSCKAQRGARRRGRQRIDNWFLNAQSTAKEDNGVKK